MNALERPLLQKLAELRVELGDLAFDLERRGRIDAADLATIVSARVGELCDEHTAHPFAAEPSSPTPPHSPRQTAP